MNPFRKPINEKYGYNSSHRHGQETFIFICQDTGNNKTRKCGVDIVYGSKYIRDGHCAQNRVGDIIEKGFNVSIFDFFSH